MLFHHVLFTRHQRNHAASSLKTESSSHPLSHANPQSPCGVRVSCFNLLAGGHVTPLYLNICSNVIPSHQHQTCLAFKVNYYLVKVVSRRERWTLQAGIKNLPPADVISCSQLVDKTMTLHFIRYDSDGLYLVYQEEEVVKKIMQVLLTQHPESQTDVKVSLCMRRSRLSTAALYIGVRHREP